ncbi:hypothetical protein [Massilia timonae]|uniref:hypothetical protein n=1 Tax=Massilia timonae TaxID=47229 RepID=UPI00115FCA4B|nr:hypothetical protein [Massilia timonae]
MAKHLNAGDIPTAVSALHAQAEHFLEISERRGFYAPGRLQLESRARWLIHTVSAVRQIQDFEDKLKKTRKEIEDIDGKLISSIARLQEYIASCAIVAEFLDDMMPTTDYQYPIQPKSRIHFNNSPLSFLQSFSRPRPPLAHRYEYGRPCLHKTIEREDYDHRLFVAVAMSVDWQNYFCDCLRYYRDRLKFALTTLSARDALSVSKLSEDKRVNDFDDENAIIMINEIRTLYNSREAIKMSAHEPLGEIDYFYECLASCEKSMFITDHYLPNTSSPYYGKAPIGMPYIPSMHPRNIFK